MLLAVKLVALALGAASCPSNLANDLPIPASSTAQQLITVEAASARATYATARIWKRVDGCWLAAGGAVHGSCRQERCAQEQARRATARRPPACSRSAGRCTATHRTPASRTRTSGSAAATGGSRTRSSRAYNTFQRIGCGRKAAVQGDDARHVDLAARVRAFGGDRVQHAPGRARARLRNLSARPDRQGDERLRQPAAANAHSRAALARSRARCRRSRSAHGRRYDPESRAAASASAAAAVVMPFASASA